MTRRNASGQREYILDESVYLRSWGLTHEQIAAKLGVQPESLRRALQRAAERGDPRSDWEPHTYESSGTYSEQRVLRQRARGWVA